MTRFECTCRVPSESTNPRKEGTCNRCLGWLNPAWTSNDTTLHSFYERLSEGLFPLDQLTGRPLTTDTFDSFRALCETRERRGRERWGQHLHGRDNPLEGAEEASDLANYAWFDTLVARRAGDDEEEDLALTAAQKAYEAYEALMHLRAKRGGAP